jgi:hypothetical protein
MRARNSHRRSTSSSSRPRTATHAAQQAATATAAFTDEWWSSWRRANALGWDYLNAAFGLMRLNLDALTRAGRLPFDLAATNSR